MESQRASNRWYAIDLERKRVNYQRRITARFRSSSKSTLLVMIQECILSTMSRLKRNWVKEAVTECTICQNLEAYTTIHWIWAMSMPLSTMTMMSLYANEAARKSLLKQNMNSSHSISCITRRAQSKNKLHRSIQLNWSQNQFKIDASLFILRLAPLRW